MLYHHPLHAYILNNRADELGIPSTANIVGMGIEEEPNKDVASFFITQLKYDGDPSGFIYDCL